MSTTIMLVILILTVLVFIGSSMWVAFSLGLSAVVGLLIFTDLPMGYLIPRVAFNNCNSFVLTAIPLFLFMGAILLRTGLARDLFDGITPWVQRIPGSLFHSNVIACTLFAAMSGSSTAVTAAVGEVAIPELKQRGYDEGILLGSLCGAGTFGILIPPSIPLIVYGAMSGESVGQLFIGGVIPGLLCATSYMAYIAFMASRRRGIAPKIRAYSWKERITSSVRIVPSLIIIFMVLGLIYTGASTPTEAGAIGVCSALVAGLLYRTLNWQALKAAFWSTLRTTCMVLLVVIGAVLLSVVLAHLGVVAEMKEALEGLAVSRYVILSVICIMYLLMGCIFDGISMMLLTLPITYPLMIALGFDGIWFGVTLIILMEAALITPPVGYNIYVMQTISGRPASIIIRNSMPFFLLLVLVLVLLIALPQLVLWLPSQMM